MADIGPIYQLNGFTEALYAPWICFQIAEHTWALIEANNPGSKYLELQADFAFLKVRLEVNFEEELITVTKFGQATLILKFTPKGATWFKLLHVGEVVP